MKIKHTTHNCIFSNQMEGMSRMDRGQGRWKSCKEQSSVEADSNTFQTFGAHFALFS